MTLVSGFLAKGHSYIKEEKGHPLLKTKKIINATFNCIFVLKGHPYNKLKKKKMILSIEDSFKKDIPIKKLAFTKSNKV